MACRCKSCTRSLLGRLLGDVIKEQAGEDIFLLVEELRTNCQSAGAIEDEKAYEAPRHRIAGLDLDAVCRGSKSGAFER